MKMLIFSFATSFAFMMPEANATAVIVPANDPTHIQNACYRDAEWSVRHSSAFRHGDVRTKQRLLKSPDPDVRRLKSICKALASPEPADRIAGAFSCQTLARDPKIPVDERVAAHMARTLTYCEALRVGPSQTSKPSETIPDESGRQP